MYSYRSFPVKLAPLLILVASANYANAVTIINTDSSPLAAGRDEGVHSFQAHPRAAPPMPNASRDASITAQEDRTLGDWVLPDGSTESVNTREGQEVDNAGPSISHQVELPEPISTAASVTPITEAADKPAEQVWVLRPGSLYEQVTQWGVDDPTWDLTWVANEDVEVEVPYRFTGPLDEAVIKIVTAFAQQGVAIRVLRAKANNQLVIKGK